MQPGLSRRTRLRLTKRGIQRGASFPSTILTRKNAQKVDCDWKTRNTRTRSEPATSDIQTLRGDSETRAVADVPNIPKNAGLVDHASRSHSSITSASVETVAQITSRIGGAVEWRALSVSLSLRTKVTKRKTTARQSRSACVVPSEDPSRSQLPLKRPPRRFARRAESSRLPRKARGRKPVRHRRPPSQRRVRRSSGSVVQRRTRLRQCRYRLFLHPTALHHSQLMLRPTAPHQSRWVLHPLSQHPIQPDLQLAAPQVAPHPSQLELRSWCRRPIRLSGQHCSQPFSLPRSQLPIQQSSLRPTQQRFRQANRHLRRHSHPALFPLVWRVRKSWQVSPVLLH